MAAAPAPEDSLSRLRERAGVRAAALRHNATDAETLLWYRLRNRQLLGLKFRRQRPIGPYFADFACLEIGLVIELDGGQHVEQVGYDEQRERVMKAAGYQTLRFWNHEVLQQTDAVMERIWQVANTLTLTPTLSRKRERE
jgi:very-short-patch-repair endonuclease